MVAVVAGKRGDSVSDSYLILWRIVALWVIAVDLSVVEQVVVHQVPSPALVITAEQGHIPLALHGRSLGGDAYHRHCPERAFPPDLPRVPPFGEAYFAACAICALGDGVAMQGEAVLLHINVTGAVYGAQTMLEGLQLWETTQEGQLCTIKQCKLYYVIKSKTNKQTNIKTSHQVQLWKLFTSTCGTEKQHSFMCENL